MPPDIRVDTNPAFHVSICGGGIGGLMLAVIIGRYSTLPVELFEAGPTVATFGAGIGLNKRTTYILRELGLYDQLIEISAGLLEENAGLHFRKSDQRDGYHWFSKNMKPGPLTIHRKDWIDFLLRHVPSSCKIHTSKKLQFYNVDTETGKVTLHFVDGSRVITDVLVGADGIYSATRKTMYQRLASSTSDDTSRTQFLKYSDPMWTGLLVYRNLIPAEKLAKEHPDVEVLTGVVTHIGNAKSIVAYPISQGKLINVAICTRDPDASGKPFKGRWVMDVPEKEVVDQFESWEIHARALVKCLEKPSRWALHSLRPLPHYVNESVALIGDAAHAMEPHFGAGAGQAVEDAFVLGRLLTHELTHRGNVANALQIYEQVRLPFANGVLQASESVGRLYHLQLQCQVPANASVPNTCVDDPEVLEHVRKRIEKAWEWQNEPVRDWEDAEKRWRTACGVDSSSSHARAKL